MHFDASIRVAAHILRQPRLAMKNNSLTADDHIEEPPPVQSERDLIKNAELELGGPRGPDPALFWFTATPRQGAWRSTP